MSSLGNAANPPARIYVGDGSAAAPAIVFGADTDTGIYRIGANSLGIAAGGVLKATIDASGLVATQSFADGSAASPSIAFSSQTNTGFYREQANSFSATSNGVRVASFYNINSVDVGILAVIGGFICGIDGTAAQPAFRWDSDSNTGIYRGGADNVSISAGGTGRLFISTTDVTANVPFQGANGSVSAPSFTFNSDLNTGLYRVGADEWGLASGGQLVMRGSTTNIAFYTQNVERWDVNSSGNLVPNTDNSYSLGQSGSRTSSVWSANGTIQTSHSSTKDNIVDVDANEIELPRGVFYKRDGRRWLGYLNDSLPVEGRPFDEKGNICAKDNYEQAVIGVLCAHVRKLEKELAEFKANAKFN